MPPWALASVVFFAYVTVTAELGRGLAPRVKWRIRTAAAAGAALSLAARRLPADGLANVWILPPVILLIGYWTSGLLFVRAMPRLERALVAVDAALRIQAVARQCPRLVAEILEFAYAGIYSFIVVALVIALGRGMSAERFWTTILITDYVCFGMLPWVQTRPPRSLGFDTPWRSRWRAVNLRILDAGSVQANTFPSGHAAEALTAALLVAGAPWPLVVSMFAGALAISAGAVLGRYHYAADAIAGWAVALIVYSWTVTL